MFKVGSRGQVSRSLAYLLSHGGGGLKIMYYQYKKIITSQPGIIDHLYQLFLRDLMISVLTRMLKWDE